MESPTRYETPDSTPVDVPFGFSYESLADTIGRMVRIENSKTEAKKRYVESFKESQDFDEDPDEFSSPHELTDMQEEMPAEWLTEAPPDPPPALQGEVEGVSAASPPAPADAVRGAPNAPAEGSPTPLAAPAARP